MRLPRLPGRRRGPRDTRPRQRDFRRLARWRRRRRHGRRWRLVLLVVLVAALLAGGGWLVLFSPYLTAEQVQVSGERTVPSAKVRTIAQVPLGRPLARVDLDAVRARVEQIPVVRSAEVARSWPHTLHITITERTPVAVVDRGNGLHGVDASGVVFGRFAHAPKRLPLIRAGARVGSAALAEAAEVAAALPRHLRRQVDYISLASPDAIDLRLHDGRLVRWGSADRSEVKARVAQALLKHHVRTVDVTVPERPTTRS